MRDAPIPIPKCSISKRCSSVFPGSGNSLLRYSETMLLNSRHDMTRRTYTHKRNRFQHWCVPRHVNTAHTPLPLIMDYILQLKQDRLANSSIRVHPAAITTFQYPIEGHSVFTYPLTKHFLGGIQNLFPHILAATPTWDPSLVLHS